LPDGSRIENAVVSTLGCSLARLSCLEAGEFVSVIGPNGAGRTTMLTITNGLGHLVVDGLRSRNPLSITAT
jgi:ABC-type Mn2+/Zn2+ transport system ATPase subunit